MTEERLIRVVTEVGKYALLLLFVAGVIHGFVVLITGEYHIYEYGVRARLTGLNARVAAGLELLLLGWVAFEATRSELFRHPRRDAEMDEHGNRGDPPANSR